MDNKKKNCINLSGRAFSKLGEKGISKYSIPKDGSDARDVYRQIHDELELNKTPNLNLATFVATWMEDEAKKLAMESIDVNLIDRSIYPMTTEIQKRITYASAKMLNADFDPEDDPNLGFIRMGKNSLLNGDDDETEPYIGTLTIGSSEAVMLAMLAHKKNWQNWFYSSHPDKKAIRPELVIGGAYQICWEKVYKFFDIDGLDEGNDCRIVPLTADRRVVTAEIIKKWIDDDKINARTMGIGLVLGTTLTGEMDELKGINDLIKKYNDDNRQGKAHRIPIHIDAAYGGFVLPFTQEENDPNRIAWDFGDLSEVQSINLSNHKFGWVYPGLGTVIFRNTDVVPEELFTTVDYLGGEIYDYALNFSRPSSQVICQYYNYLRYGMNGYKEIMARVLDSANHIAKELTKNRKLKPYFELLTANNEEGVIFPNLVFRVNETKGVTAEALSDRVSMDGWTVPGYSLPIKNKDVNVLRMVIKENISMDLAKMIVTSFEKAVEFLADKKVENEKVKAKKISGRNTIC
ncbi:MAG: glutamate decarboxylase [bacterium]|nr:glutamate decarboxylase [bacterium]